MDFTLPEEARELAALARTILTEHSAPDRLTRLEGEGWLDRECWQALAGAGLLGIVAPESAGGLGLDLLAAHVVAREVGATAAHVPLVESSLVAATVLADAPDMAGAVAALVDGSSIDVLALSDEDGGTLTRPTATATPEGDGWMLAGTKSLVPCAPIADAVLVSVVGSDGAPMVLRIPSDLLVIEPQATPSDVPHGRVLLEGVRVGTDAVVASGDEAVTTLDRAEQVVRLLLASTQSGGVAAAIRLAAAHTSEREQFGVPLATFQAVSQRVADARIAQEMLDLTSLQAAWMLAEGLPATDELLIAGWWTCDAGHHALHAAQHVHGGIGVDREYPLHRLFGRAKLAEFQLGHAEDLLQELGARIAAEPSLT